MNQSLLSALVIPLACASVGDVPTVAPVADVSWRTYDFAAVAPTIGREAGATNLVPALASTLTFEDSGAPGRERGVEYLAQTSVLASSEEFERDGRSWEVVDDAQLQAFVSGETHKNLERELAFYSDAFRSAVFVRVDVVDGEVGPSGFATRIPAAAAEDLVGRALAQGRARTALLRIAPGDEARLDHTRDVRLITDYDCEVAQQAVVYQPVSRSFRVGLQLAARAAAVADGVQLALTLREVDELAPPRERTVKFVNHVGNDQAWAEQPAELVFQSPRVVQHAAALTTFLPKGEAVLLRSALTSVGGNARCTIVLRAVGEPVPVAKGIDLYDNGFRIDVVDLSRFAPPYVKVEGALLERGNPGRLLEGFFCESRWEGDAPLRAEIVWAEHELDLASDRNFPQRDALVAERFGPWLTLLPSTAAPAEGPKHARNFDPAVLANVLRPKSVEIDLVLRKGDAVAARWSASVVEGRRSAFTVGAESLGLDSVNVEIAQSAAIFDPQERVFFDGLIVAVEPRRLPDGALDIGVTARAMMLDAEPTWAVGMSGATPPSDRATWTRLIADERVLLPPGTEPRSAVLGVGGKGGLLLEVSAR
ncbi:MAG: hypothetical protein K8S98_15390 [Planctomycetes bacterium]|nr:hypothetical protein [Planctomycetota bacterium]